MQGSREPLCLKGLCLSLILTVIKYQNIAVHFLIFHFFQRKVIMFLYPLQISFIASSERIETEHCQD